MNFDTTWDVTKTFGESAKKISVDNAQGRRYLRTILRVRTCGAEYEPKRFEEILGFEVAEVVASHPLRADSITISGDKARGFPRTARSPRLAALFSAEVDGDYLAGVFWSLTEGSEEKRKTGESEGK
ncbi:MAG: hypothetical protein ACYDCM_02705 [Candidatus Acidiferrales bacterium]